MRANGHVRGEMAQMNTQRYDVKMAVRDPVKMATLIAAITPTSRKT